MTPSPPLVVPWVSGTLCRPSLASSLIPESQSWQGPSVTTCSRGFQAAFLAVGPFLQTALCRSPDCQMNKSCKGWGRRGLSTPQHTHIDLERELLSLHVNQRPCPLIAQLDSHYSPGKGTCLKSLC